MSPKTGILDALEPGDITGLPDSQTIEFAGRTFRVMGFAGDNKGSGILILGQDGEPNGPIDLVRRCHVAAANILVMSMDWSQATPDAVCRIALHEFAMQFRTIFEQHAAATAARGKPS